MDAKLNRPGGRKHRNPGRPAADAKHTPLSKEFIVAKGLELCRRIPLQEVSIVRVARELSVTPALLHYYLGGREALTSGVMNAYYRELTQALPVQTGDWKSDIAAVMRTIYQKDVNYGGIVAYVMSHNRYRLFQDVEADETDYGILFFDRLTACVRQAGLNASRTAMFVHLLLQHVLASAYQQTSHQLPGDHHAFLLSRLNHVDTRERPNVHFVLEAFSGLNGDAAFEAGLDLLIEGMAGAADHRRGRKRIQKRESE
jgi:AcrR family transcriptional regulator